jgi:hypothetical protein
MSSPADPLRPITDSEMREAVARNEDRIRGYGGEYGSHTPPTPREYRVEMFEAFALFNAGQHREGCAKALAAFDGLRESLNNEIGELERRSVSPTPPDAETPRDWFCNCGVWGRSLTMATAEHAHRIASPGCPLAPQWEEVMRRPSLRELLHDEESAAPPDAETPRERELWDALEEFALARHHATADEGAIVPRIPESAVRLVKAHDRIVELFARCGAANSLARGQRPGGPAHPSVAAPPDDRGREIGRQGEGAPPDYDELADAYSRQIEHTNRVRAAYQERCRALDERIAALVRERDELSRMLETATVRLEICRDRFAGCEEDSPGSHPVSLLEIPGWIEEQRAALTPPEARADDQ